MLRRFLQIFILLPLAALLIVFSIANRHLVTISLDPLGGQPPIFTLSLPLFILVFAILLLGILLGGVATWVGQRKWRRQAQLEHREAERWRGLAEEEARRAARQDVAALPARGD